VKTPKSVLLQKDARHALREWEGSATEPEWVLDVVAFSIGVAIALTTEDGVNKNLFSLDDQPLYTFKSCGIRRYITTQ
jgi:hypothetical protein